MPELHFITLVQEGSHYDVGAERGRIVRGIPSLRGFFTQTPPGAQPLEREDARARLRLMERWCPGMEEELTGFADALGLPPEGLIQLRLGAEPPRGCTLIAVDPRRSADGHTLAARSYEFSPEDELCLSVTRVPGRYAHMGFSLFQTGRFDGINERGLCAAMATCECVRPSAGESAGLAFWVALRRVLDSCATTAEALALLGEMPLSGNTCYLLADRGGDCAVLETLADGGRTSKAVRRGDGALFAVNHYLAPEHTALLPQRRYFSAVRQQTLERRFAAPEKIGLEELRALLGRRLPDGLCCHAYSDWFGTLRAMLFDVTAGTMEVCFGPTDCGHWFPVDLHAAPEVTFTTVSCEDEQMPASFWQEG